MLGLRLPSVSALSMSWRRRGTRGRLGAGLCVAVVATSGALTQFAAGRAIAAWLLLALGWTVLAFAFWRFEGHPRARFAWPAQWADLIALGAILATAAALRLVWLDGLQGGDAVGTPGTISELVRGPAALAPRLPPAVGGTLGVAAIFLLARELFGRRVGLIAAGFLATLGWHVYLGRAGLDGVWAAAFGALGLFLLVRGLRQASWTAAVFAGLCLGLGQFTFDASPLVLAVAAAVVPAFWFNGRREHPTAWRVALAGVVSLVMVSAPLLQATLTQASRSARGPSGSASPGLSPVAIALLVLGLLLCLSRLRRPEYILMVVWSLVALGGLWLRTGSVDSVNLVAVLCALPLGVLWQAISPDAADAGANRVGLPGWLGLGWAARLRHIPTARALSWLKAHPAIAFLPLWSVIAVAMTDPLWRNLSGSTLPGGDAQAALYVLWWNRYALLTLHQSPLISSYMFAPQTVSLGSTALLLLPLSIGLQLLVGLHATLNLMLLGSMVACSLAAFLLISQESGSTAGAFVGSLIFTYAAYHFANLQAGHPGTFSNWAVPLFLLFLLRWLREDRFRDAALAGLFLGIQGLLDPNQMSMAVFLGALALPLCCWRELRSIVDSEAGQAANKRSQLLGFVRRWFMGMGTLACVGSVVISPLLIPQWDWLSRGFIAGTPLVGAVMFSPDLLAFVSPPWWHPVLGRVGESLASQFQFHDTPKVVYLGFTATLLALIGCAVGRRPIVRRWAGVAVLFALLSLGPILIAGGRSQFLLDGLGFTVPLPFVAYHMLPLIGGVLVPAYFTSFVALSLGVLAAFALGVASTRLAPPVSAGLGCLLAALVLFEAWPGSLRTEPALKINPVYTELAKEPDKKAVLEEPLGWQTELGGYGTMDPRSLYFATVHEKPIVQGYISRGPNELFNFYLRQPELAVLVSPDLEPTPESRDVDRTLAALRAMDVGYVIIHAFPHRETVLTYVREVLQLPVFYSDSELTAFRVP